MNRFHPRNLGALSEVVEALVPMAALKEANSSLSAMREKYCEATAWNVSGATDNSGDAAEAERNRIEEGLRPLIQYQEDLDSIAKRFAHKYEGALGLVVPTHCNAKAQALDDPWGVPLLDLFSWLDYGEPKRVSFMAGMVVRASIISNSFVISAAPHHRAPYYEFPLFVPDGDGYVPGIRFIKIISNRSSHREALLQAPSSLDDGSGCEL